MLHFENEEVKSELMKVKTYGELLEFREEFDNMTEADRMNWQPGHAPMGFNGKEGI